MTVDLARRLFTVEDYHRMLTADILTEDDRVELIAGEIVEMAPIGSRHAAVVRRLTHLLTSVLGDRCLVSVQSPLRLSDLSEPEPDLALLRARADFYAETHPIAEDALLVVEVADTTLARDRDLKGRLYASHGVSETWLLDLTGEALEVYRQPTPAGYRSRQRLGRADRISMVHFPDVQLKVSQMLP